MASSFGEIIESRRILVCVGSGGVGKTTTAAVLAIEAARRGRRALVLTIDPAKRLANALGLEELGHEVSEIHLNRLGSTDAGTARGTLHAMMLDQKRAFDEMVCDYARSPEAVKRVLENPIYNQISGSLAGAHEYAALSKLRSFSEAGDYDTIVVDTPPTSHALDFLDAPSKLSEAIDSPAVEWFIQMQSGGGRSVIGKTGTYILRRLAKFTGSQFLDDMAVFFTEFNDVLGGFRKRADEVSHILRQPDVGFVLVANPEPMAVREALFFYERLAGSQMPFAGFVVNRVHRDLPISTSSAGLMAKVASQPEVAKLGFQQTTIQIASDALYKSHSDFQVLAAADRDQIVRLHAVSDRPPLLVEVPLFTSDIHDIEALRRVGRYLFADVKSAAA